MSVSIKGRFLYAMLELILFFLLTFIAMQAPPVSAADNWTAPDYNGPCVPYWFPSKAAATACINAWVAEYNYKVEFNNAPIYHSINNGYTIAYGYYYYPYTYIGNSIYEYRCNQDAYWDDGTHSCVAVTTYYPAKNLGNGADCDGGEGGGSCQTQNGAVQAPVAPDMAGDPINAATGNKYEQEEDFSDVQWLVFRRFYNSSSSVDSGSVGANWRSSFDRSLNIIGSPATTIVLNRPDGKEETFNKANGAWTPDPDISDVLTEIDGAQGSATGYTVFISALKQYETYDATGTLQGVTDDSGQGISLSYSTAQTSAAVAPGLGFLIGVVDSKGRQLSFSYNISGQLTKLIEPDGSVIAYGYDSNGNLTSVNYPDNRTRQYVYNEFSLTGGTSLPNALTGSIDEAGSRYSNTTYNGTGQATSSYFANNVGLTQIAYNGDGSSTIIYPLGSSETMGYVIPNGVIRIATLNQPCGTQCELPWRERTYDANGNPQTSTDFNGITTATTYNSANLLTQQIDAQGTASQRTTNFTWNTTLRVPLTRSVLDASGNPVSTTQWAYNATGQTLARCDIDPTNAAASGYACTNTNTGTVPAGVRRTTYTYCTTVDTVQCPLPGLLLAVTGPRTDLSSTA
ncbi:DUF6531 domain-containing protein, partial [Dyella jejuensis]